MRKLHPVVMIGLCLVGCKSEGTAGPPVEGVVKAEALKTPVYGEPITPAGSEVVLIPFSVDVDRSKVERRKSVPTRVPYLQRTVAASPAASMAFQDRSMMEAATVTGLVGDVDWNNVILFDRAAGTSRLLLDRRAVLTKLYYPRPAPRAQSDEAQRYIAAMPPWPEKVMLLGIADADTNGDGFIDAADAAAAYSCDLAGRNQARLTPADEQFVALDLQPEGKWIYLTTRADADRDGTFDGPADEVRYYAVDASNPSTAAAMVPADARAAALRIVTRGKAK